MLWIFFLLGIASSISFAQRVGDDTINRRDVPNPGGQVIDNIFNIPITALKQTAAAAQTAVPENSRGIDSVFKIPISTLEAVGELVKTTSAQRRLNADEIQKLRQERRDRVLAQRERQRQQREQLQNQRLQLKQRKKVMKRYHKDPLGVNALTDLLMGHHGLLGGHGSSNILSGIHAGHGGLHNKPSRPNPSYEVHENVEEDNSFTWHGLTAGIGSFTGSRPSNVPKIQNKIAPKEDRPSKTKYRPENIKIENKIAPGSQRKISGSRYRDDFPIEHRSTQKNDRIVFH